MLELDADEGFMKCFEGGNLLTRRTQICFDFFKHDKYESEVGLLSGSEFVISLICWMLFLPKNLFLPFRSSHESNFLL